MSTFEINSEALDAAYRAMRGACDTIEEQRGRHNHAASGIEGMLANAASVLVAATGLDLFSIWEQWGFGGVAQTCSATSGSVECVRGTIQRIVEQVSEAHRGELAPVLHDRATGLRSALDNVQERLWSITSLLNPGNLLHLLASPWTILDHFSAARDALDLAHTLAQDYSDFLARLLAREKELIEEILSSFATPVSTGLTVTTGHSGSSLQGNAITIQGNSATLQGSSGYLQGEQPVAKATDGSTYSSSTEKAASHLAGVLDESDSGVYNILDLDKLRNDPYLAPYEKEIVALLTQLEGNHPIKDAKGNVVQYGNVQCVALVAISLMLAGVPGFGLENGTNGVRNTHLAGDAGNAENWYPNLKGVPGWERSDGNTHLGAGTGHWEPRKGDLIVWQIKDAKGTVIEGHIAVVTSVDGSKVSYSQANTSSPTGTLTISADGTVHDNTYPLKDAHGHIIKDKDGNTVTHTMSLEGFLRYDGH